VKQGTYILFSILLWRPKVNNAIEIITGFFFYICINSNKLVISPLNIKYEVFITRHSIVENDKKRRLRNLKNLLKGLQQIFVIPYRSRLSRSPKNTILISSDRKKSSMNSQNKVYLHVIGMRNN